MSQIKTMKTYEFYLPKISTWTICCMLIVFINTLHAQTPQILHKKLGDKSMSFDLALQAENSALLRTNFGLPPTIFVKRAVIDSVIAINDSTVVVSTTERVVEDYRYYQENNDSLQSCHLDSMLSRSITYDLTGDWKPGKDTLINHKIFNVSNTCEEIVQSLIHEFKIAPVSLGNTRFIGFDCGRQQAKKNEVFGFFTPKNPPFFYLFVILFSLIYFLQYKIKNRLKVSKLLSKPAN